MGQSDPLLRAYHDEEWGVPEYESRGGLGEKLMLDGFRGRTILGDHPQKTRRVCAAFQDFEPEIVARFGAADVVRLLEDSGIVRSSAKIEATIGGARAYLAMQAAGEDFSTFAWSMAGGKPIQLW